MKSPDEMNVNYIDEFLMRKKKTMNDQQQSDISIWSIELNQIDTGTHTHTYTNKHISRMTLFFSPWKTFRSSI